MLEVEGVTFTYPHAPREAVKNLTWTVFPGETWAVVGRNGSGKSTLALLLNGILKPQKGRVRVEGLDTREEGNLKEIRRRVGVVFQDPDNQLIAQTVEEDVAFGLENLGLPPAEIRARVDRALKTVGLDDLADRPPHQLSGGQKQRLALAGVLAMEPRYLVLDEATAMLDPIAREEILQQVLKQRREQGIAVILISHLMEEALLADRMLVMQAGKITWTGQPREIVHQDRVLAAAGLRLPAVVALGQSLRRRGFQLGENPLNGEELARVLWKLASRR